MTDQTEYSFLDWTREFGGTDADIRVVTKDKMILKIYGNLYGCKTGNAVFLKMKGNTVIQILEKPMA